MEMTLRFKDFYTQQRTEYDCGVSTIVTVLKYYGLDYKGYNRTQIKLREAQKTGTTPVEIIETLRNYGLVIKSGFPKKNQTGLILLNTNKLYSESSEDQNGHWCFLQYLLEEETQVYDLWADTKTTYDKRFLQEMTKDVKIKDEIFNGVILSVYKEEK